MFKQRCQILFPMIFNCFSFVSYLYPLTQWFPTFWVLSPGILFYKQCWSHVASKLREICYFGNFSGPTWTFFKSRYWDQSRLLGTSALTHSFYIVVSCFPTSTTEATIHQVLPQKSNLSIS